MTPQFHLYIACCTADGGVAHAVLYDDGTLQQIGFVSLPSPMYFALDGDRLHTLLCDPFQTGESGVTAVSLRPDGTLGKPAPVVPTGGGEACFLSVADGNVFCANYQTGSVARISENGALLVRSHTGHGTHKTRQDAPHPHYIAPSPDGKFLLCADLGTDTIITYDRDLCPLFSAKTPDGSGARHLVSSPDGRFVYAVGEIGNTVTVFSYENGRLTPLETVNALPGDHAESFAAAVRLYDGKLYISHRGADCVTAFTADGERLMFEESVPSGGKWPRDFDWFGDFLVCTNEKSDSVTVLRRRDGGWTLCSSLALPRPLCVVGKGVAYGV